MKLTKRRAFNFFRSYYDVYNELSDKDKVQFMDALLNRQFLGVKPEKLTGMAKFAYISQVNSIDSQVKGYEDKTGIILSPPVGGTVAPTVQGKEKEEEKEEVKEEENTNRFKPPTVNMIYDYILGVSTATGVSNNSEIAKAEADKFFDFYSSKNWMVGKNKMKDWKAACRNWVRRMRTEAKPSKEVVLVHPKMGMNKDHLFGGAKK